MLPVLALLSAVAPLATDLYLPAFPDMATDFGAPASRIQLTLTAFLLGMALGQLLVGPLSDGWGRRRLLLGGTALCFASTVACLLAPTVDALIVARLLQGISGGAGVVLARAIVADTVQGPSMAKMMGAMMLIGGIAPITAPLLGSLLLPLGGWRLTFGVLAALVGLMFLGAWRRVPETLPPEGRHGGGIGELLRSSRQVLGNRRFVGYLVTGCGGFAALFAYISASPFVVQGVLGLSAQAYGLAFGANAMALVASGALAVKLAGRVSLRRVLAIGLGTLWTACALQIANLVLLPSAAATLALMGLAIGALGLVFGNNLALALAEVPHARGTASAFMGSLQFGVGAAVSPLVGIAGPLDARPMALVMLAGASVAVWAFVRLSRGPARAAPPQRH